MKFFELLSFKIMSLLTILIPSYDTKSKLLLVLIWAIKYIVDCDALRPGHSGYVYKLTIGVSFEMGEIIVVFIQFVPAVIFMIASLYMKTWIPAIPGVFTAALCLWQVLSEIKDAIKDRKKK